ncbi:DMT family transporter [Pseudobacteroides cellulosolvens]|nr:DMT family transporter [Pseudobacteroides cellulosolvens]
MKKISFVEKEKKIILGPLQMLVSSILFAVMNYTAKLASEDISGSEVAFFRLLFGVVIVLILSFTGVINISSKNKGLLVARGVFGGTAVLLLFIGIASGSMTNSVVLNNTHPIFAAIVAIVILKEKITFKMAASILISWVGIIILFYPDMDTLQLADMLSLASGILGGFAIASVRQLRKLNESAWTIFFYFCIFGLVASFIFCIPTWKWPNLKQYILLLLTGFFGMLAQVMMTSAYKYCKAAIGGVLSMSTCVFTAFLGILLINEPLTVYELIGAVLIVSSSVFVVVIDKG